MRRVKKLAGLGFALLGAAALTAFSPAAANGVRRGLDVCAKMIIPSLLPLLAASGLLTRLGFPGYAARVCGRLTPRLFGVGGEGAAAVVIGLCGGYPMGAAAAADIFRRGDISSADAERLLYFCNNCGPAFIIGVVGSGVFGSAETGLVLYTAHAAASLITGILTGARVKKAEASVGTYAPPAAFGEALTDAVKAAASAMLNICAFVVFFAAVTEVMEDSGLLAAVCGRLAALTGLELRQALALVTGFLELGGGAAAMSGLPPTAQNLTLSACLLGWGGISVHCQTAAVLSGSGLRLRGHSVGRAMSAVLSAILTRLLCLIFHI